MRPIKIRSGGQAFVLEDGDTCPPGGICFLKPEWEWAMKISKSFVADPEQLQSFWADVMERKKNIPGYVLFMDFPVEKPAEEQVKEELIKKDDTKKGLIICGEILQMLAKHKQHTIEE